MLQLRERHKFCIIIFLVLVSCNDKKSDKIIVIESKKYNSNKVIKTNDSIMFQDLEYLNKQEAIQKYENPASSERFILDDPQREFRNAISDKFTTTERQSESWKS